MQGGQGRTGWSCTGQGAGPLLQQDQQVQQVPQLFLCAVSLTEGSLPSFSQLEMILFQRGSPSGNGLRLHPGAEFSLQDTGVDPAPLTLCPAARKRAEAIWWRMVPWIFLDSQAVLDCLLLQPAGQASTVTHRPPHCTSPPQPQAAQVEKEEKQQKSSTVAQAHWEHTGNEITD